ncbi:hypothetical protein ACG7TL_008287 [Trametes sanguinea]
MSDSAALVDFYQQTVIYNYIGFATFVATIYDWLLCLGQETQLIWPQPRTGASALYFFNRYLCTFLLHLNWVAEYIMLIGPAVFSCLRVYALTGRNTVLSVLTLFFGLMPFVLNMATIYAGHVVNEPMPVGCTDEYTLSATVTIAGSLIFSDLLVIAVTWWSTYKISRLARSVTEKLTLNQVMLENGTIYFLCMTCLNVLQVLLNAISLVNTAFDTGSYTEGFIDLLTSVLISRFLLNLRATSQSSHTLSTPSFVASHPTFTTLPHFVSDLAGQVHSSSSSTLEFYDEDEEVTTEFELNVSHPGC